MMMDDGHLERLLNKATSSLFPSLRLKFSTAAKPPLFLTRALYAGTTSCQDYFDVGRICRRKQSNEGLQGTDKTVLQSYSWCILWSSTDCNQNNPRARPQQRHSKNRLENALGQQSPARVSTRLTTQQKYLLETVLTAAWTRNCCLPSGECNKEIDTRNVCR